MGRYEYCIPYTRRPPFNVLLHRLGRSAIDFGMKTYGLYWWDIINGQYPTCLHISYGNSGQHIGEVINKSDITYRKISELHYKCSFVGADVEYDVYFTLETEDDSIYSQSYYTNGEIDDEDYVITRDEMEPFSDDHKDPFFGDLDRVKEETLDHQQLLLYAKILKQRFLKKVIVV